MPFFVRKQGSTDNIGAGFTSDHLKEDVINALYILS